jgi:threonine dehydratase
MAVRAPDPEALELIRRGAERVVEVSDDEVAEAIRILFSDTHSTAEGAGAAALAGFIKDRSNREKRVAVVLTGQNIDRPVMQEVLAGRTPRVA